MKPSCTEPMKLSCAGCRDLRLETWPNGVMAARCFSDRAPVGRIQHRGRVVELLPPSATAHGMDNLRRIFRPAWCPRQMNLKRAAEGDGPHETDRDRRQRNGKTEKEPI